jgi:hypothetical protein
MARRGIAFRPTTEVWATYCRQLYPGHERPRTAFGAWKLATTAVNITRSLWEARERARLRWQSDYEPDPAGWPVEHPPVVLWVPNVASAACLQCSWVSRGRGSTPASAGRAARKHSIDNGGDLRTVRQLRVPVSQRGGPYDPPLDQAWV